MPFSFSIFCILKNECPYVLNRKTSKLHEWSFVLKGYILGHGKLVWISPDELYGLPRGGLYLQSRWRRASSVWNNTWQPFSIFSKKMHKIDENMRNLIPSFRVRLYDERIPCYLDIYFCVREGPSIPSPLP